MQRALVTAAVARFVALLLAFTCTTASVRILLEHYGSSTFAAISVLATLTALIPFADLGLGIALTNLTVEHEAGLHSDRLRPAIAGCLAILTVIGASIFVGAFGFSGATFLHGPLIASLGDPDVYLLFYGLLLWLWLYSGLAIRLLFGFMKTTLALTIMGAVPVLTLLITIAVVTISAPPWVAAAAPLASSILASLVAWAVALRLLGRTAGSWRRPSIPETGAILREGTTGILFLIGVSIAMQSDRLLVAHFSDAQALATLAVIAVPFGAMQSVIGAAGTYLWPHYRERRLTGTLGLDTARRHILVAIAAGAILAVVLIATMPIYLHLVGYHESWHFLTFVYALLLVAVSACVIPSSILTSPRSLRAQGFLSLGVALAKVGLAAVTIQWLGAAGAVLATLIAVVIIQFPIYLRLLSLQRREWWQSV